MEKATTTTKATIKTVTCKEKIRQIQLRVQQKGKRQLL